MKKLETIIIHEQKFLSHFFPNVFPSIAITPMEDICGANIDISIDIRSIKMTNCSFQCYTWFVSSISKIYWRTIKPENCLKIWKFDSKLITQSDKDKNCAIWNNRRIWIIINGRCLHCFRKSRVALRAARLRAIDLSITSRSRYYVSALRISSFQRMKGYSCKVVGHLRSRTDPATLNVCILEHDCDAI